MRIRLPLLILLVVTALGFRLAFAQVNSGMQAYTWYDDGTPKRVFLDRSLVAELGSSAGGAQRAIRIRQRAAAEAERSSDAAHTAPVFRDSEGGRLRTLPGNIIVRLHPQWGEAEVQSWLVGQGLTELRRMPFGRNILVVAAPPGMASLELANRLQQSGSVVSAQPDWWHQSVRR